MGRIVGSNGGVIWRIGQKSGCKVEVEVEDHGRSRIHLMESSHGVQTARKIIGIRSRSKILEMSHSGLLREGGGGGGAGGGRRGELP